MLNFSKKYRIIFAYIRGSLVLRYWIRSVLVMNAQFMYYKLLLFVLSIRLTVCPLACATVVVHGYCQLTGVGVEPGSPGARRWHVVAVPVPGTRWSGQRQWQLIVPGHCVQRFGQICRPFQDHFLHAETE